MQMLVQALQTLTRGGAARADAAKAQPRTSTTAGHKRDRQPEPTVSRRFSHGASRDRTGDLLLAKSPRPGSADGRPAISPVNAELSGKPQIVWRCDRDGWCFHHASIPSTQPVR